MQEITSCCPSDSQSTLLISYIKGRCSAAHFYFREPAFTFICTSSINKTPTSMNTTPTHI